MRHRLRFLLGLAVPLLAACAGQPAGPAAPLPPGAPTAGTGVMQGQTRPSAGALVNPINPASGSGTAGTGAMQQGAGATDASRVPGTPAPGVPTLGRRPVGGNPDGSGASQFPGITTPAR